MKYVYLIESSSPHIKMGCWSSSVNALRSRYRVVYADVTMYLFQCDNPRATERALLNHCRQHRIRGELFSKDAIACFWKFCTEADSGCRTYCESADLNAKMFAIVRRQRDAAKKQVEQLQHKEHMEDKKLRRTELEVERLKLLKERKESKVNKGLLRQIDPVTSWVHGSLERDSDDAFITRAAAYRSFKVRNNDERGRKTKLGKRRFYVKLDELLGSSLRKKRVEERDYYGVYIGWKFK
jgi:hypothetical protein